MARTRTTKKLAQRIDLNYFKRPTPFKRAKVLLSVLVPLVAVGWIAWRGIARDSRVYSSGRMSSAHAVLELQCAACHLENAGEFSSKATDAACLACHDGPTHQADQITAAVPNCVTCHAEHRGRIQLTAASNESCAACHRNLKVASGAVRYAARILSLEDGHPEFAALRDNAKDPGTIKLNHAIHMKPVRQGPNGPVVQLECEDCHRNYQAPWKYALTQVPALASYQQNPVMPIDNVHRPISNKPLAPSTGRERMPPVEFARACSSCHLLTFDKRFDEGVPHDTPQVVHAFLLKKFQEYIAKHPAELRLAREPNRELTGKPLPPEVRVLTPAQWTAERTADAETLLWRKTCKQCHAITGMASSAALYPLSGNEPPPEQLFPKIQPAAMREQWLPHAKFGHDAHRGFSCVSCHPKALTSAETSDLLVPGIANCKTCHAPGPDHAESRCFECHTYHDWSKRKEVKATFTLPALHSAGR